MNEMNEKTQKSHECKRPLRLQKRQVEKNAATSHREQSRRAGETSQENQQLRLQRRRKQKRARVERETRD